MTCEVCSVVLEGRFKPCHIAPRYYVNGYGFIVACIGGCPYEGARKPDYVHEECLPRMKAVEKKPLMDAAKELNNGDYQNLWASRYRQNYHLDFDARERTAKWYLDKGSGLFNAHPRRRGRSEEAYWRAVLRPSDEGLIVVPHYSFGVL